MLVVLDGKTGALITKEGRGQAASYFAAAPSAAPAQPKKQGIFGELFGEILQSKSGAISTTKALKGKTKVMLYFSAHWCPPCRAFTPQLADLYKQGVRQRALTTPVHTRVLA